MRRSLPVLARVVALLILTLPATGLMRYEPSGCAVCHGREGQLFEGSVHLGAGFGCVDCHGGVAGAFEKELAHGDGLRALSDAAGAVAECSGCHSDQERMRGFGLRTDQLSLYATSRHGTRLAEDGSARVATCASCHGSHAIFRASDTRSPAHKFNQPETCGECHASDEVMAAYGLTADVVQSYRDSVHGEALLGQSHLSSPACSDCHGSHGATPPGVDEVGRVCGHCHSVVQDYFEESPHFEAARAGEIEECISCHGYHDVREPSGEMLAAEAGGVCYPCHREDDDPGAMAARTLDGGLRELEDTIRVAEDEVRAAGGRGAFMEREHGYLDDARSLRARARSMTHTLSAERLEDLLARGHGMVEQTYDSLGVKERVQRDRKIFTTIFLGVTVLLAGVLQTYRREAFSESASRSRAGRRGTD